MDSKQSAAIEFLTKEGCRLSDIHRRLQNVYGGDTMDKSNMHRMKKFKEGETGVGDLPTATTDTDRHRVDEMIHADGGVTIRQLAAQLDCGHNAVQKMVEDLGYRKECGVLARPADPSSEGEEGGQGDGDLGTAQTRG